MAVEVDRGQPFGTLALQKIKLIPWVFIQIINYEGFFLVGFRMLSWSLTPTCVFPDNTTTLGIVVQLLEPGVVVRK